MVSHEDNRVQTMDFRGDTSTFTDGVFQNQRSVRIVMKAYGRSLENFTSMGQVLGALHNDAIAGELGEADYAEIFANFGDPLLESNP
jgi:hypothetical protein